MFSAKFHSSISEVDPQTWDRLFNGDNPFVKYDFLRAMEQSGCVDAETGWQPQHLLLVERDKAVAALPLYLKSHSYGEFVFDWGWAEAYERHGLDYYPKLVSAIPFTPSSGPRIGFAAGSDTVALTAILIEQVRARAEQLECSSWHLLFPDPGLERALDRTELLHRKDIQFHWFNRDYGSFDDYLAALRSSRRKSLRRERRRVGEQGVTLERKTGDQISQQDWSSFFRCHCSTYLKRSGHPGYLTREFFELLLENMRDQLLLVVAKRDDEVIACALFLFDSHALYGRYWGALADVHSLHFEACFYQGIEFCIENRIARFDPGTQGEHKLLRGFEPIETCSFHWIAEPRFRAAIAEFLHSEKQGRQAYGDRAAEFLPFKNEGGTD